MDMTRLLSRTPGRDADRRNANDEWGKTSGSGIWITGRTVFNMWRLIRSELKLCSYTLQVERALRSWLLVFGKGPCGRNVGACIYSSARNYRSLDTVASITCHENTVP